MHFLLWSSYIFYYLRYDFYHAGIFTLHQNALSDFQVQVRFERSKEKGAEVGAARTRLCAIGAKEREELFVIDICSLHLANSTGDFSSSSKNSSSSSNNNNNNNNNNTKIKLDGKRTTVSSARKGQIIFVSRFSIQYKPNVSPPNKIASPFPG